MIRSLALILALASCATLPTAPPTPRTTPGIVAASPRGTTLDRMVVAVEGLAVPTAEIVGIGQGGIAVLDVIVASPSPLLDRCDGVRVRIDGAPALPDDARYRVARGQEHAIMMFGPEGVYRLASATLVEFEFCGATIALDPDQAHTIREFAQAAMRSEDARITL